MMKKAHKNNLDEMQDQKLLKLEEYGFWVMFWALVLSIVIQLIIGSSIKEVLGEIIVLLIGSVYISVTTLKNALLETENAVLIEASPYDGIYGAGLAESDLLNPDGSLKVQPENWKNPKNGAQATNHLGFVLMGIRDLFRQLMEHSWRPGEEYKSF